MEKFSFITDSQGTTKQVLDPEAVRTATSLTYAELRALRDNAELTPGQLYRVTDYVTTTTQTDTRSADHPFDILLFAATASQLSETAYATHHQGDTYFQNSKLEAWQLQYSLDNDTDRFPWADEDEGRGVIYSLRDEFGNQCPYDFKNILFRRRVCTELEDMEYENQDGDSSEWETRVQIILATTNSEKFLTDAQILGRGVTGYTLTDTTGRAKAEDWLYYALDSYGDFYKAASNSLWASPNAQHRAMRVGPAFEVKYTKSGRSQTAYAFPALVRQDGAEAWLYTFTASQGDDYTFDPDGDIADASLAGRDNSVYDNTIHLASDGLNGNVFYGSDNYGIHIGTNCLWNTFGQSNYGVRFGVENKYNSWGNYNRYSSWGNENSYSSWGNYNRYSSWGNGTWNSSWGNENYVSSWGNDNSYSSWGNENSESSWGNDNYASSWGNENCESSWGNNNYASSWGNDNSYSSWGNENSYSSWGNYNHASSWGNYNSYSSWGNENRNITYFNGIQYTVLGDEVRNAQVLEGTSGTQAAPLTLGFSTGESYCQVAGLDSEGTLRIWCPADVANAV